MTKLQITSDGSAGGTEVLVDGKPLDNVVEIRFAIDAPGFATATITLQRTPVEIDGEMVLVREDRRYETLVTRGGRG